MMIREIAGISLPADSGSSWTPDRDRVAGMCRSKTTSIANHHSITQLKRIYFENTTGWRSMCRTSEYSPILI